MFNYLIKKIKYLNQLNKQKAEAKTEQKLSKKLEQNITQIKNIFGESFDLKVHQIQFGEKKEFNMALMYIDGLVNIQILNDSVLRAITTGDYSNFGAIKGEKIAKKMQSEFICVTDSQEVENFLDVQTEILKGNTVLLFDTSKVAISVSTTGWEKRAISEPQSETVVRGPREGFNESIKTNITLIRRKIKNSNLRVDHMIIGRKSRTDVCLLYLNGVASEDVIKRIKSRLKKICVDSILDSGFIEEYIEDAPFSPFATVGYTEKPDVVAAKIFEGRVAIVVDGTPFVLTAPMLFIESFQTTEDYSSRWIQSSINRILRFMAYFISVFGPAIYIALTAFHQELIPTTLLMTIASAREGTPFPVFLEALIMAFAFEILREAGIRLPRPVGQAISIVGALVMGDAAVSAGLVGAPMVITIAFTAVSSFLVPNQVDSITFFRLIAMIFAATLGFFGVLMCAIMVLVHLCTLTSFGVPYYDGLSYSSDLKDSVVRIPLWKMKKRPKDIAKNDTTRMQMEVPPQTTHDNHFENEGEQYDE